MKILSITYNISNNYLLAPFYPTPFTLLSGVSFLDWYAINYCALKEELTKKTRYSPCN